MNAAHDVYRHRDGTTCILVEDGTWFVPLDVGGEGYTCTKQHGPPPPTVPDTTIAEALAAWESKGATSLTTALVVDALYRAAHTLTQVESTLDEYEAYRYVLPGTREVLLVPAWAIRAALNPEETP